MKYQQLKQIINTVKRSLRCQHCGKMYRSEHIELLDIFENEGVIEAYCPDCNIGVSLNIESQEFSHGVPSVSPQTIDAEITDTDVRNISTTLQKHTGGVKDLLNRNNPRS